MIIGAVLLAGLAGFLLLRPPAGRALARRLRPVAPERASEAGSGRPSASTVGLGAAMVATPVVCTVGWGAAGFWLSLPLLIFGATVLYLVRRGLRRRRSLQNRRLVAQACSVLAAQMRIGQVPLVALRSAAEDCPVLRPAVADADLGGDAARRWTIQAAAPGMEGLADLARGWRLAINTGAEMAAVLDDVAEAQITDAEVRLVINSEAAGPRASGKIMAALPLVGIGLGYAIGGDPLRFLLQTPYGWGCLLGGSLLACAGVLWMERVADTATTQR